MLKNYENMFLCRFLGISMLVLYHISCWHVQVGFILAFIFLQPIEISIFWDASCLVNLPLNYLISHSAEAPTLLFGAIVHQESFSIKLCKFCLHFQTSNLQFLLQDTLLTCRGKHCYCCSVAQSCDSLWLHGLQHARLPCPSLSRGVCINSSPWVNDSIQPFHPLSPSCAPTLNLSQHQGLFQWVGSLYQVAKVLWSWYCPKSADSGIFYYLHLTSEHLPPLLHILSLHNFISI